MQGVLFKLVCCKDPGDYACRICNCCFLSSLILSQHTANRQARRSWPPPPASVAAVDLLLTELMGANTVPTKLGLLSWLARLILLTWLLSTDSSGSVATACPTELKRAVTCCVAPATIPVRQESMF